MAFKFDCFNFIYDQDQLSYGINDTFQNLIVGCHSNIARDEWQLQLRVRLQSVL